jgi:hypothetical protein
MIALARACPTCGVITLSSPQTPEPRGGRSSRARCGSCTTILDAVKPVTLNLPVDAVADA